MGDLNTAPVLIQKPTDPADLDHWTCTLCSPGYLFNEHPAACGYILPPYLLDPNPNPAQKCPRCLALEFEPCPRCGAMP